MDGDLWSELEWRGLIKDHTEGFPGALGEPITVYTGFDATASSLHAGHLIPMMGLHRFQQGGHQPIALVGGGTTLIGDPSGRDTERPLLSVAEIDANVAAIAGQLERFLAGGPVKVIDNADWLRSARLTEFLRDVGKHFSVNVMMAKESVQSRLQQGISYTEFSYQLLQAYDFLHLCEHEGCRVQLGGSDQWGNITAGIDLIRRIRGAEAHGMTWPLLTRDDGSKFGKSDAGENIWLDPARTSPYRFYQYWLNCRDDDLERHLKIFTDLSRPEIEALSTKNEHPERREGQRALATLLTGRVHGPAAAEQAQRVSEVLFGGADPAELDEATLAALATEAPSSDASRAELGAGVPVVDLLAASGLVASKSAARNAVQQGGVYLNGRREAEIDRRVTESDLLYGRWLVLRRGRKDYHLVRFG